MARNNDFYDVNEDVDVADAIAIKSTVPLIQLRSIVTRILHEAKITDGPVYVPQIIETLKLRHQQIILEPIASELLSKKISGVVFDIDEQKIIAYQQDESYYRKRFTIAHEIGHIVLGTIGECEEDRRKPNERLADSFAAELLMPYAFVKQDIKLGKKPLELKAKYRVSEEALWNRLRFSKLLDCY